MKSEKRAQEAIRITAIGAVVNALLMAIKLAAGVVGGSQAMIADAIHTLSDFATDIAVVIGVKFSQKPRDCHHAYGHGKYETVAAAIVGLALLVVGLQIGWHAIHKISAMVGGGVITKPTPIAFWAATLSIVVKEVLYRQTITVGRRTHNTALVANAWHHRSDALSSVGTAIGIGMATFLGPEWTIMDPVAAIIVSILLLKVAITIVKEQMDGLTERALPPEVHEEIEEIAKSFDEIHYPHNIRTRMVGKTVVMDMHVRMDPTMRVEQAHEIVSRLEEKLCERFGDETLSCIHIEPLKWG